ncbi:hypothetical protein B296_00003626 [Ensete ventricosum]|uniref:Uncharacterized protein n=1 Tax=Ensete ventricosum TaxID=4639 RepID=A0A427AL41_ENSVE|nr:hypothetical protein B296_00003626 [Ensete ventricosum]
MAVTALRHGQRLLAALVESKVVALGLTEGCKAESSSFSTMTAASHGCMGKQLGFPNCKGLFGWPRLADRPCQIATMGMVASWPPKVPLWLGTPSS